MDAQLRKGILDVCVLSALKRQDSYGYKIIKDVSSYVQISESTLYPILKRLETLECVTVYSVEHNGRLRKYYKITSLGRDRIQDFLEDWKDMLKAYEFIKEGQAEDESK